MNSPTEKAIGSNLTAIAEYTETAAALADLRQRHQGVVYDVTVPKEMKAAKESRAELRTLRTTLEKTRKEIKAPALERCRLIDDEAKRITAELVALEEPIDIQIKTEEARAEAEKLAKLEADRLRLVALQDKIDAIRNVPAGLVGKPSVIIAGQLAKLEAETLDEDEFAEHFATARDALDAAIARVKQQLVDQMAQEAEAKKIAAEREELERIRADNARLQREADERAAADRAEADRKAQVERDRIAAEEKAQRDAEKAEQERLAAIERDRLAAEQAERDAAAKAERDRVEAEQQAERERQAETKRRLDAQAAQIERDRKAAVAAAEKARLAGLGLREAAAAVVQWASDNGHHAVGVMRDLEAALANDAAPAKTTRGKRSAAA